MGLCFGMQRGGLVWGEGHTRRRERGWESPNSDKGTYFVVLFILYIRYFVGNAHEGGKVVMSVAFFQYSFKGTQA
jgi:hypothetical protein